jgi:NTP pyrophosphatase (non-canonical NTP hydrolase)
MTTNFQKVGEFHKVFGHPQTTIPQLDITTTNPKLVQFRTALIEEELSEFKEAVKQNDFIEMTDALADMLYVIYGAGHALGIDLDKVFAEVHASNMSKLCQTEEEAQLTVENYKKTNTVYKNPQYRQSGNYWTVYDADTSKILKSINFKLPDIKSVLVEHQPDQDHHENAENDVSGGQ